MYRTANINMIDSNSKNGEREEQDYSILIYIVKMEIHYGILLKNLEV